jgi:hypothetical protein
LSQSDAPPATSAASVLSLSAFFFFLCLKVKDFLRDVL